MLEQVLPPQPYLRLFPPATDVFAEPVERYARHLLPLVSIDLSVINPAWHGWIHLLNTVEPQDEMIGIATHAFHSDFLRENWVGFRLNAQDRYELLGDFRFFELENEPTTLLPSPPSPYLSFRSEDERVEYYKRQQDELAEHYARQHTYYKESKALYERYGGLYSRFAREGVGRDYRQEASLTSLDQLGGGVGAGNWASGFALDESDPENVRPLMPDGTPFHFVASVAAYNYCDFGADDILLFYEPQSRTALFGFDWS